MERDSQLILKMNFNDKNRSRFIHRMMVLAIVQSFLFLPTTHFAQIRNLKSTSAPSTITARSLRLAAKFSVSPTRISVSPDANSGTLSVVAPADSNLSVSNPVSWITVSAPATRAVNNNETLTYSVSPNTSCTNRVGIFYVKTQAVTITQAGVTAAYSVSPSSASFTTNGGNGSVSLSANCLWSLQSDASWITITSPSSGSDNSTINFSIPNNSSNNSRSGSIKVRDGNSVVRATLIITQNGVPLSHSLSSTNATFSSAGGNSNVVLTATQVWAAQSDVTWIKDISPSNGSGNATITYSVAANSDSAARTGSIKILDANSVVKQTLTIGQTAASATYSLSSSNAAFASDGGSSNVVLNSSASWSVQSSVTWITGITPASGLGNATISYSVAGNTSCASRSGLIKIVDANSVVQTTLLVTQAGITGDYTLSSTYILFPYNGGRISVGLSARCNWTVQTDVAWISNISPSSGNTNATIYYTVAENTSSTERQGFIRILDGNSVVRQTLRIAQTGSSALVAASPDTTTTKSSPSYVWSENSENGKAMATDADGSVVSAGSVNGNIYLQKYSADGAQLWLKWLKGAGQVSALALDGNGNIYLAGLFAGAIDFGGGALASSDAADIYLAAYSPDGNHLWSEVFVGAGDDYVQSIGLNSENLVIVGSFSSQINFGDEAAKQLISSGSSEVFLTQISLGNGEPLLAQRLGDSSGNNVSAVALDFLSQYAP